MKLLLMLVVWIQTLGAQSETVHQWANKGYPFVQVIQHPDSLEILPGPLYLDSGVLIQGDSKAKSRVLNKMLGLQMDSSWSLNEFQSIPFRLKKYPYYDLLSPPEIFKHPYKRYLYSQIHLQKKASSTLEMIAGGSSDQKDWRGQLLLDLQNISQTARDFYLSALSEGQIREFVLQYKEPWLFDSPWDLRFLAEHREDSLSLQQSIQSESQKALTYTWRPGFLLGLKTQRDSISQNTFWFTGLLFSHDHEMNPFFRIQGDHKLVYQQNQEREQEYFLSVFSKDVFTYQNSEVQIPLYLQYQSLWKYPKPLEQVSVLYLGGPLGLKSFPYRFFKTKGFLHLESQILFKLHQAFAWGPFGEWALLQPAASAKMRQAHSYGLEIFAQNPTANWKLQLSYALHQDLDWKLGFVQIKLNHYF